MRFRVRHLTSYSYSEPVRLGPQWLRLRPRAAPAAELLHFALDVDPAPAGRCESLDADGNLVTCVWFDAPTAQLSVRSAFEVRTERPDSSDLPAEPMRWDAPYAPALQRRLAPWLDHGEAAPPVQALARELRDASGDVADFLGRLNLRLHHDVQREIRDTGAPHAPEETLRRCRGACRDLAVLFVAACRSQGLAARFVSGYQARGHGASGSTSSRHMHAWPEVYLSGGWRGFDPTHGQPVADAHVALAAAAHADDAAPVSGHYYGAARSALRAELSIDVEP